MSRKCTTEIGDHGQSEKFPTARLDLMTKEIHLQDNLLPTSIQTSPVIGWTMEEMAANILKRCVRINEGPHHESAENKLIYH